MKIANLYLVASLAIALPGTAAIAQTDVDVASVEYCNQLTSRYMAVHPAYEMVSPEKAVAMAQCKTNPQASIAILEQAMKNARIDLPARVTAASHTQ